MTNNRPKPIFASTIRPDGKLFYLDIYQHPKTGVRHLSICETIKGVDGSIQRIRINVSPKQARELRGALCKAVDFFDEMGDCQDPSDAALVRG